MNEREHYQLLKESGVNIDLREIVRHKTNRLLDALFIPNEDGWFQRDPVRCGLFGIKEEPINWSNLKVVDVIQTKEDSFIITIDEADSSCHTLCSYIERMLNLSGWVAQVKTEW